MIQGPRLLPGLLRYITSCCVKREPECQVPYKHPEANQMFGAVIARYQAAEYAKKVFTYPLHSTFACVIFSHCEEVLGFVSLG